MKGAEFCSALPFFGKTKLRITKKTAKVELPNGDKGECHKPENQPNCSKLSTKACTIVQGLRLWKGVSDGKTC